MKTTLTTIAIVFMLGFIITANSYTWGKPYTPAIVTYIPWWSWVMFGGAIVAEFTREWMERK